MIRLLPRAQRRLCDITIGVAIFAAIFIPVLVAIRTGFLPMMPFPADPWASITAGIAAGIVMLLASLPCYLYARTHIHFIWAAPRFIRGVASSVRSGLPLYQAVEEVARTGIYGTLGRIMLRAVARIKAGMSFEAAMRAAAREAADPVVDRLALLLAEADAAGPKAHQVLDSAAEYFSTLEEFMLLRDATTRPYFAIVYMMVGVYLLIVYIIVNVMLAALSSGQLPFHVAINRGQLAVMFYWQSFVSAIAAGVFLGKITYNNARAGLFHAAILSLIITAFFALVIFGPVRLPLGPGLNITATTPSPGPA